MMREYWYPEIVQQYVAYVYIKEIYVKCSKIIA